MNSKRILVIQTAFIGDVILATSLVETLHATYPEARIDFLLRKGNEGLFENHPFVKNILIWRKKEAKFKSLFELLGIIRRNQYDIVVNIQRFAGTGILTGFSKATVRIGYNENPFSFLFTQKVKHVITEGVHEITRNHALLRTISKAYCHLPKLYSNNKDKVRVASLQKKPYICIAPSSVWYTKKLPIEKWVSLINVLHNKYNVYLLGASSDDELCQKIVDHINPQANTVFNLAGKFSFLESAALMKEAVMNYVNDSAPLHICSAINAPVAAIFCSTIPAFGFGPLSVNASIIENQNNLKCRPCGIHGKKECPEGHFKCAMEITNQQLLNALD